MTESGNEIFRKNALKGQTGNDLQNELPVSPRTKIALPLWLLGGCVVLICIWALVGQINENTYGTGIITRYAKFSSVNSPSSGSVIALDVQVGDEIRRGQLIGRIFSETHFEQFLISTRLLEHQQKVLDIVRAHIEKLKIGQSKFTEEEISRLNSSLDRMEEQLRWHRVFVDEKVKYLVDSGAVSKIDFMKMKAENSQRISEYDSLLSQKSSAGINLSKNFFELENKLLDYELTVRRARFEAEQNLRSLLVSSRVISYSSGVVANVNVSSGEQVSMGQELVRLVDTQDVETTAWSTYCFFPVTEARKLKVGMQAAVTPSTVKAEQDGSIYGIVSEVQRNLETRESLMFFSRNSSFADYIFQSCRMVPVKVKIALSCNNHNPSGFNWTSGPGPDIRITPGTMCSVKVTTNHYAPIELLLGKARRYLIGSGVMEEKMSISSTDKE